MPVLVDTNVLLDVVTDDPVWGEWSYRQLEAVSLVDALVVNAVIYAELSVAFDRIEDIDDQLAAIPTSIAEIPRAALFVAGRAYLSYRRGGGAKTGVPPDFFIGAHAAIAKLALLTRDVGRYRTTFPTVELIAPNG